MNGAKFNLADLVRLKSGGPPMTIIGHPGAGLGLPPSWISCAWIAADGTPQQAHYPEEALVPADKAAADAKAGGSASPPAGP